MNPIILHTDLFLTLAVIAVFAVVGWFLRDMEADR